MDIQAAKPSGQDKVNQAQARLKSWSIWGSKSQKYEDAADLYRQAANLFLGATDTDQAVECYRQAQHLYSKVHDEYNICKCMIKIAQLTDSVELYLQLVNRYEKNGNFRQAGKYQEIIALIYKSTNPATAIEHYSKAAIYYQIDNYTVSANNCIQEKAKIHLQLGQYDQAKDQYIILAETTKDNVVPNTPYILKAILGELCSGDIVAGKKLIDKMTDKYPRFIGSSESQIVAKIITALEDNNLDDIPVSRDEIVCQLLQKIKTILEETIADDANVL